MREAPLELKKRTRKLNDKVVRQKARYVLCWLQQNTRAFDNPVIDAAIATGNKLKLPVGKGRVWVCDFDLEESVAVDPVARMFAENLFDAAADPNSTVSLIVMPTHEEILAGKRVMAK